MNDSFERRSAEVSTPFEYDQLHEHELSGIPNRTALNEALDNAVTNEALQANFALVFIDLDHLKAINDDYGHLEGDDYIKDAAAVLMQSTRESDMTSLVTHLGGDEFVVLLADVKEESDLAACMDRLHDNLDELGIPNAMGGKIHEKGESPSELMKAADQLMNVAKIRQKLENLTPEQVAACEEIIRIALEHRIPFRDLPGILEALQAEKRE